MSNTHESSEGAPGRLAIAAICILFLAAIASTWFMYIRMPPSFPSTTHYGASTVPLGYAMPPLTIVPRTVSGTGTTAQVELLFGFDEFNYPCYNAVVAIVREALELAAPGAALVDQDSIEIDHKMRLLPPADDWRFGFVGAYEGLDESRRADFLSDVASAIEIQLVTPNFEELEVVDIQFNYSGGRAPLRWRLGRDTSDRARIAVSAIAP